MNIREECQRSVRAGLDFLEKSQLPSGEFLTLVGPEPDLVRDTKHDPSIFTTVNVATSLLDIDDPQARRIVRRAADFLLSEMLPGGLWRFWTKAHPGSRGMPPDVDDTSCVSWLLRRLGCEFPDNRRVLLHNRRPDGRFFTWITPRIRHLAFPEGRSFLVRAFASGRARAVYFKSGPQPPSRRDTDCVVNANVITYLAHDRCCANAAAWVAQVVQKGDAASTDRWYQSPAALLYAVARGAEQGIPAFSSLKALVAGKSEGWHPFQGSALEAGLRACALSAVAPSSLRLVPLIEIIFAAQEKDGGWAARAYYYDSYKCALCWGSRELTTGFCLEALSRYAKR